MMALSYDVNLQVEDPTGSNNWVLYPGGITRQTGEQAHYRIFFTFSSTDPGSFDRITLDVDFADEFVNITNVHNIGIPAGTTYSTRQDSSGFHLHIDLGANPPGMTAFIEFQAGSRMGGGPDGYEINTLVSMTGSFTSSTGTVTPISMNNPGPTWTVSASIVDNFTKTVYLNGDIYTPDAEAYLVEYKIANSYIQGWYNTIGSWGVVGGTITDTLPAPSGILPEVLYCSMTPYTVSGNVITWNFPATNSNGAREIHIRVRYPKDQVDAAGGIDAIGNLTNTFVAHDILTGNVPADLTAEVTHRINPIPSEVHGTPKIIKEVGGGIPADGIPGYGLYYGDLNYYYKLTGDLTSSSPGNTIPASQTIKEDGLYFILEDDSVYYPGPDEFQWSELQINGPNPVFEYQTYLNGTTWFTDTSYVTGVYAPFPVVDPGDYITKWKVTTSGFLYPSSSNTVNARVILKKRTESQPKLKFVVNNMSYENLYDDGTSQSGSGESRVPVVYNAQIVTSIYSTWLNNTSLNPGNIAYLGVNIRYHAHSTVTLNGSHIYAVIPPGFTVTGARLAADTTPVPYEVTSDWDENGSTLVHLFVNDTFMAMTEVYKGFYIMALVDPLIIPGTYRSDYWYVINSDQANDPAITHLAAGLTAKDIYEFDNDGDTEEQVAMRSFEFTVMSNNVVNVFKMSKSARDDSFELYNDTRITKDEIFQYKMIVRNDSPDPMTNVVMIDIFPYPGDMFGSGWAPVLTAAIADAGGATVYYSTSTDPILVPISDSGTGSWSLTPPEDITTVKAIKLDYGSRVFAPGESAEIMLDMRATDSAMEDSVCYNSVKYIASADIGGVITPYLPAFSPPGYAQVTYRAFNTGIGDYVWFDVNRNGIQDINEVGIDGVPVNLYDENRNLLYTTVTGISPVDGTHGYYMFSGIWPGNYYVEFPANLAIHNGYTLTAQNAGDDLLKNSKPHMITGFTEVVSVADEQIRTDIDAGYIAQQPVRGILFI